MSNPSVLLSAFGDEGSHQKTILEQLSTIAAIGLQYYSVRFVNVSGEIKNVMNLDKGELKTLKKLHAEYGVKVTCVGSPIGKVKLLDIDDKTHNRFVPFKKYLSNDVATAIDRAVALETKLIRGFSFYHPKGTDPAEHISQTVDQLGAIADKCAAAGLVYGLEVEANLVGQNGRLLAEISKKANRPNMVCVYDGANLSCQNYTWLDCYNEYKAMLPYIGWIHIKDYAGDTSLPWTGHVDEERIKNFVPVDVGNSGHEQILRDFREHLPKIHKKMLKLGAPGVFLELEPHLKGGGQFGGFSGPDGLGVACRSLCKLLDYTGIDYHLRDFDDIKEARGF